MVTQVAQTWIDSNFNKTDKNIILSDKFPAAECDELDGKLVIEGYNDLEVLNLERKDLAKSPNLLQGKISELIIRNCPKLKKIDVDKNVLKSITFEGSFPDMEWLDVRENDLAEIEIGLLQNLKKLFLINNSKIVLENIKGLEELVQLEGADFRGINSGTGLNFKSLKALKNAIKSLLGITGDLPSTWQTDLTSALGGKSFKDMPSGQTLASLIDNFNNSDVGEIKTALGLGGSSTKEEIINEINKLKGTGSGAMSKGSLESSTKNTLRNLGVSEEEINKNLGEAAVSAREVEISRNKLIHNRFNGLQTQLNYAHYLNIGLGTLSVLILLVLVWMVLKDRKLLSGQEEE